ncbi:MAG TPA: hypothetical protein VE913_12985 [Longimicrobium sp.]|nr:hypothetical protein [Longimicrobium sp.]
MSGTLSSQGNGEDNTRTSHFAIEPALKIHAGGTGAFQPYTFASIFAGIDRFDLPADADGDERGLTLGGVGASVAVGMDWLPVSRVSIGGRVGVRGAYLTGSLSDDDLEDFSVGTFNSGILVNLFF